MNSIRLNLADLNPKYTYYQDRKIRLDKVTASNQVFARDQIDVKIRDFTKATNYEPFSIEELQGKEIDLNFDIFECEISEMKLNFFVDLRVFKTRQIIIDGEARNVPVDLKISALIKMLNWQPHDALFYDGCRLDDRYTLDECGVRNGSTILKGTNTEVKDPGLQASRIGKHFSSVEYLKTCVASLTHHIGIACLIKYHDKPIGTGFLISSRHIMTNYHVVDGKSLKFITATFDFGSEKNCKFKCKKKTDSKTPDDGRPKAEELDFAILELESSWWHLRDNARLFYHARLYNSFFKLDAPAGDEPKYANIIHYPDKQDQNPDKLDQNSHAQDQEKQDQKQISFRYNQVKKNSRTFFELHYDTETEHGSSGSPVFDDFGKFIGLHFRECNELELMLYDKLSDAILRLEEGQEIDPYTHFILRELSIDPTSQDKDKEQYVFDESRKCWRKKEWSNNLIKTFDLLKMKLIKDGETLLKSLYTIGLLDESRVDEFKRRGLDETDAATVLRFWALHYLSRNKNRNKQMINEQHLFCNKAINAQAIYAYINKNQQDLSKEIKNAQRLSQSTARLLTVPIIIVATAIPICYYFSKKTVFPICYYFIKKIKR